MPQFDPTFFPAQIFWLIVSFAILYFLLARLALPRVGKIIETREQRIAGDLDRAASLRNQAETIMTQYEKALAESRARASDLLRQAEASIAKETTERQTKLGAELGNRIKDAEGRIATAKSAAMSNLQSVASDAARATVQRLIGTEVAPAEAEQAAASVLQARLRG